MTTHKNFRFLSKAGVFFLTLLLFFSSTLSYGMPILLYIHGRQYTKPVLSYRGSFYAVVQEIFPAFHYSVEETGRLICAVSPHYQGPACPKKSKAFLVVDGKPVTRGLWVQRGKIWIALPVLADVTGLSYLFNPQTGIAVFYSPALGFRSEPQEKGAPAQPTGDALKATITNAFQDTSTNEMRVSFTVQNSGEKPVDGVTATLRYLDGNGKEIHSVPFALGTLAPGQTVSKDDYWLVTMGIYPIRTDVKLTWKGKS